MQCHKLQCHCTEFLFIILGYCHIVNWKQFSEFSQKLRHISEQSLSKLFITVTYLRPKRRSLEVQGCTNHFPKRTMSLVSTNLREVLFINIRLNLIFMYCCKVLPLHEIVQRLKEQRPALVGESSFPGAIPKRLVG